MGSSPMHASYGGSGRRVKRYRSTASSTTGESIDESLAMRIASRDSPTHRSGLTLRRRGSAMIASTLDDVLRSVLQLSSQRPRKERGATQTDRPTDTLASVKTS